MLIHRGLERRRVTVMLCELVDSVALFEKNGSADFLRLIEGFRTMCRDQVRRFGGTVVYLQGDSMLACFGYALSYPNDPERGVRTAISIANTGRDSSSEAYAVDAQRLKVRIGIDTGKVIVGHLNKQYHPDYLAIFGDPINVAARLQSLAKPNQIILSERTTSTLRSSFKFLHLGCQSIRCVANPITIFEVQI